MGKMASSRFLNFFFNRILFILAGKAHKSLNEFDPIGPLTAELDSLGRLENIPIE